MTLEQLLSAYARDAYIKAKSKRKLVGGTCGYQFHGPMQRKPIHPAAIFAAGGWTMSDVKSDLE